MGTVGRRHGICSAGEPLGGLVLVGGGSCVWDSFPLLAWDDRPVWGRRLEGEAQALRQGVHGTVRVVGGLF